MMDTNNMRHGPKSGLRLAAAMVFGWLALQGGLADARAAFIQAASGNSRPGQDGDNATINFAVLNQVNGREGDTWGAFTLQGFTFFPLDNAFRPGAGSGKLDTTAKYLYLFEITNNSNNAINNYLVPLPAGGFPVNKSITSWGFFGRSIFQDNSGRVGVSNPFGRNSVPFSNPAGPNIGVENPTVNSFPGGIPPSVSVGPLYLIAVWGDDQTPSDLTPGKSSSLFGFTSNLSPSLMKTGVRFADNSFPIGAAPVPTPIPGPASIVLAGVSLPFVGFLGFWQRRKKTH